MRGPLTCDSSLISPIPRAQRTYSGPPWHGIDKPKVFFSHRASFWLPIFFFCRLTISYFGRMGAKYISMRVLFFCLLGRSNSKRYISARFIPIKKMGGFWIEAYSLLLLVSLCSLGEGHHFRSEAEIALEQSYFSTFRIISKRAPIFTFFFV